jgi:hypothetical protein
MHPFHDGTLLTVSGRKGNVSPYIAIGRITSLFGALSSPPTRTGSSTHADLFGGTHVAMETMQVADDRPSGNTSFGR